MVDDPRQRLVDATGDDEMLFADGFDAAIVGYAQRCGEPIVVVYDAEKAVQCLVDQGMTHDEAVEFFHFNTVDAWVGPRTPVFLFRPEE